jgi:hypothetical protein
MSEIDKAKASNTTPTWDDVASRQLEAITNNPLPKRGRQAGKMGSDTN